MAMVQVRDFIFHLYERRLLRNWFYTLAFAIFVPTGYRFATLAWEHGAWFDKPLAVISGLAIGITTVITLVRIWKVPPRQTVRLEAVEEPPVPVHEPESIQVLSAIRLQAARNRRIARDAACLGPARRRSGVL